MTLRDLLDSTEDETWIRVELPAAEKPLLVWCADWLGKYEPTEEMVMPYLDYVVDFLRVEKHPNPEGRGSMVDMLCASAYREWGRDEA